MPGADKFQNGPVRFVVESTRDGQEILPKDSVSAITNRAKEKASAGTTPAVNASSCARIGRFALMLAVFAATLLAPAGVAQTNAPDSRTKFLRWHC